MTDNKNQGENNKKGHQQFDNEILNPIPLSMWESTIAL